MNFVKGKVRGDGKGFALVVGEEKDGGDVFIGGSERKNGMEGDIVVGRVL
ncbi:S1 domain-containing protein [Priestia megaterium]|nr:hypothetical protein [Priestia megaterium]